jgi:hypothetical protein
MGPFEAWLSRCCANSRGYQLDVLTPEPLEKLEVLVPEPELCQEELLPPNPDEWDELEWLCHRRASSARRR